jgi:hypothetical protein
MKESDVQIMLAADVYLGTKNCNFQMERNIWKRRNAEESPQTNCPYEYLGSPDAQYHLRSPAPTSHATIG